jgi:endoglucanase
MGRTSMARVRRRIVSFAMVSVAVMAAWAVCTAATNASTGAQSGVKAAAASAAGCSGVAGPRDPSNPLGLSTPPGSDPLNGAPFFVDGPAHGAAAGAIAQLLGIDTSVPVGSQLPSFSNSESWQTFLTTTVAGKLPSEPAGVQRNVQLLEKIASEPEAMRVSAGTIGKGGAFISTFVHKLLCQNLLADPGSVPIISTYFMHSVLGGCASTAQINAYMPLFKSRINAMVAATGSHAVVYLLELDAVGSSSCMAKNGSLPAWEAMLRYEVDATATLPHAVVYVEGGYSDSNSAAYAARILNAVDIQRIRGFFTNDTHLAWTTSEVTYGDAISRMTHGAHFIINTAQNGQGPKLNADPGTQGVEDLCNPPGRGLGPQPTTKTPFHNVDALLWTAIPGNSSGCGGGPSGGTFWPARAISLAALANQKYGPGYPSRPY